MTVPTTKLNAEAEMPMIGFGTYLIPNEDTADAVGAALKVGYRHIDTAEGYQNEEGVGTAVRSFLEDQAHKREDVFITTKLFPGNPDWGTPVKGYDETLKSLGMSLERLGLDYVDLYLIHAPLAPDERINQWRALVELHQQGKAKAIGVSNYSRAHIEEIRKADLPIPHANQIELHPWSQKPELITYLQEQGIQPIAYSSLVPLSTWRTAEGHDSGKPTEMVDEGKKEDSPFKAMAKKYGVTEAQVLLRWAVQSGYPVLPKSTKQERMKQNFDLFSFELDSDDMSAIQGMDRGDGVAWSSGDPLQTA